MIEQYIYQGMVIRPRNAFLEHFDSFLNIVYNHLNHVCEYVWHINKHFRPTFIENVFWFG